MAGAEQAQISISGGETAQLKDIVNGFDLVGMAVGRVDLDKVISGKGVAAGDVVIGVKSSGIHSNGLTLARNAFFGEQKITYRVDHKFDELSMTLGEELLVKQFGVARKVFETNVVSALGFAQQRQHVDR